MMNSAQMNVIHMMARYGGRLCGVPAFDSKAVTSHMEVTCEDCKHILRLRGVITRMKNVIARTKMNK